VLHLLGLLALGGLFVLGLVLGLMYVSGWRLSDGRDVILNRAYESFTHEGIVIPGMRPGRGAKLVIRLLSDEEDARRRLLASTPAPRR
jgi:hypothetical protein